MTCTVIICVYGVCVRERDTNEEMNCIMSIFMLKCLYTQNINI